MNALKSTKASRTGNASTRILTSRVKRMSVVVALALLAACGGGGGDDAGTAGNVALATVTTSPVPKPTIPVIATPVPGIKTPAIVVGAPITDIRIQSTGAAQTNVPFTFGQIVAAGQMAKTDGLAAKLADGTLIPLQADVKATHADGSVRHVIVSGVLPSLAASQTQTLTLVKSSASTQSNVTLQQLAASGLDSKVTIMLDNVQYTASLADALAGANPINWLSGTIANEWIMAAPLKNASGVAHPLLTARFDVRWYSSLSKKALVSVSLENDKTFVAGARNLTYDVKLDIGGRTVYAKDGLTHYHHSRWRQSAWWDAATAPAIHLQHNTAYLIASKAVSNYDQSLVPSEKELASYATLLTESNAGPMKIGPINGYMPSTGGRNDIGPLPAFSVMYLLSQDKRAKDVMLSVAEGSASWSVHLRDEKTGYPVRTDNDANKLISTHMNLSGKGPLPVPRCANNNNTLCATPYSHDTAHQPSMAYLPYLVTGDYYYLEELHFWAATNPLETDAGNSGNGQGLVRWQQLRGQAWSLRTLGHAAYITPDLHPLKTYFTKQLDNNLNYYHATFVVANPNQLGAYDGSGERAFRIIASAPWQDDFFTWSFGYLNELGFTKALPILQWKGKYAVGRMTAPGFCWTHGAVFGINFRDDMNSPLYTSFEQMYRANFGGTAIPNDNRQPISDPLGKLYIDQPCATQAQADWLTRADRRTWAVGRMFGYADSPLGYPANMQPALAVAATTDIQSAAQAWTVFMGRAAKPNYSAAPQFAIVPRQ
ncbi:hypothetical protein [Massilia varians]|uniref:hypothetical protein n=1 Tax=Massilia varians TaxID=457921 RepID=UPI0025549D6D|nr:hypothetical protein [Massilia varians]MDK6078674.1 hypothetical protein [Massilia varians]